MDYFSELLDSYSKLRKRTYKLTFISEEDDTSVDPAARQAAEQAADSLIANANESANDAYAMADKSGYPIAWKKYSKARKTNDSGVQQAAETGDTFEVKAHWNKSARAQGQVTINGNVDKNSKSYQELVKAFMQKGTEGNIAQAELTETQKNLDMPASIEGTFLDGLKERFIQVSGVLTTYAEQGWFGDGIPDGQALSKYFVPGNRKEAKVGLIGKISTAQVRKVDSEGMSEIGEMDQAMAEQILNTFEQVTTFAPRYAQAESEGNKDELRRMCKEVLSQVGYYKNRLVLFGASPEELLVVGSEGTTNQLYQHALNSMEDKCGHDKSSFRRVAGDAFSSQEKNAVKGVIFESVHIYATEILNGNLDKVRQDLIAELISKGALLSAIQNERGDSGLTLEEAFASVVQKELLSALGDNEKLKAYLVNELSLALPFAKFMGADRVEGVGLEVATGGREDINFMYSDKSRAEAKAKDIGSSVTTITGDDGKEEYAVGVGLKRLQKISRAKLGEIGSIARLLELLTGGKVNAKGEAADANLDPEFNNHIKQNLYQNDDARQSRAVNYAQDLESKVEKNAKTYLENATFVHNGKTVIRSAEKSAKNLFENIKKTLTGKGLGDSALNKSLFEKRGKEYVLKNFGDSDLGRENRGRLSEKISRLDRMTRLEKDLNSGNQAAKDYVLNMAYLCGANARNMSQLISDDTGKVVAVKHNELIDDICNDPDVKFERKGTKIIITGNGSTIALSQDRDSGSGGASLTRTSLYVPRETLEKYAVDQQLSPTKKTKEDITNLFIQGQIKLLEGLLNQTNDNLLL